jgi:PAP2 superfamily
VVDIGRWTREGSISSGWCVGGESMGLRTRRLVGVVLALAVGPVMAPAGAGAEPADQGAVIRVARAALDAVAAQSINAPRASRVFAHVFVATDLAVAAASRACPMAAGVAATQAAATVIAAIVPPQSPRFEALADAVRTETLAAGVDDHGIGCGLHTGTAAGTLLAVRAGWDGGSRPCVGDPPTGPGVWAPTPPAFLPALEACAGSWRTWRIPDGSWHRPPPPPAVDSPAYLEATQEVYDVGVHLTDEQRRIADVWAGGPITPAGVWVQIALDLLATHPTSQSRAAHVLAVQAMAQADAFVACWNSKYTYWLERPVTAINRLIDPAWRPYLVTPPFPSYVSGHSAQSAAAAVVLGSYFPAERQRLWEQAQEAAQSRLYGGIHFRFDNVEGLRLGADVGRAALHP